MSAEMKALRLQRYKSRKRLNVVALMLSLMAMAFGLFWLAWILVTTVSKGLDAFDLALFTEMTPAPGRDGGMASLGVIDAVGGDAADDDDAGAVAGVCGCHLAPDPPRQRGPPGL